MLLEAAFLRSWSEKVVEFSGHAQSFSKITVLRFMFLCLHLESASMTSGLLPSGSVNSIRQVDGRA